LQTLRLSVPEASKGIVNQNFTYVLTGLADQSSSSHSDMTTTVESGGRNVAVEQTQTSFQTNNLQQNTTAPGNQAANGQLQSRPQLVLVTVTPQTDGTTGIVIQQGGATSTTLLSFTFRPRPCLIQSRSKRSCPSDRMSFRTFSTCRLPCSAIRRRCFGRIKAIHSPSINDGGLGWSQSALRP
jgi:hypothetical protein